MFGPFSPGDSLSVYRLQRRGIPLDLQRDLMHSHRPLWEAWLAFMTQQAMGQPTYILHDPHDGEAFVQIRYRPHQAAADIAYLAPSLEEHSRAANAWSHLLDGACIEVATRGIQRVFANLPASGAEVETLHGVGFTLYAEEEVYRLVQEPLGAPTKAPPTLRAQKVEDWPALQKLCVAVTPQRVRQAEGGIALPTGPEKSSRRYVLPALVGDDLVAALSITSGELSDWLQVLVHPDARQLREVESARLAETLIHWGLTALANRPPKAIFCSVRQYENGVRDALRHLGFELYATRALTVKPTVAWIKTPIQEAVPGLKGTVEPVPPVYRMDSEPELVSPEGRWAAETRGD